ncbi:MAG: LamB/YcsF family protein, partial [Gammaproteobacteria bacterium]|nr:LamB/YcsF family protein [Gammaproteobacteria bacterium]
TLPGVAFVGLPGSELQNAANEGSLRFIGEGFVDRAYQANGQLVPRSEPGAVHDQLDRILSQAVSLVGKVDTLCVHGDTPGAAEIAREVRKELEKQGVKVCAFRG